MPLDFAQLTSEQWTRFRSLPPEIQALLLQEAEPLSPEVRLHVPVVAPRWRQRPGRKPG